VAYDQEVCVCQPMNSNARNVDTALKWPNRSANMASTERSVQNVVAKGSRMSLVLRPLKPPRSHDE
jgi:hypothetical protein